jgi:hypothetical protein
MQLPEAQTFTHDEPASRSRLLIALSISLVLHLALVLKYGQLNPGIRNSAGLQITLIQAPGKEAARVEVARPSDEVSVPSSLSTASRPAEQPKAARKIERQEQTPALAPSQSSSATPALNQAGVAEQKEQSIGIPLPGMTGRVSRAAINFDVFSGADRQLIASGQHLYVADRNDNFGISIKQQPNGAGADEQNQWHIEISGRIGSQGLAPFLYETLGGLAQRLMTIKDGAEKAAASTGGNQKWRMPDGIIDRQSLLYYFMFKPPELAGGKVLISDGASYALFSYRFAGTESFSIAALGEVHSVKLAFATGESSETIELWVVPALHYLPVKARYIDKQGLITEQAATAVDFN